MIAAFDESSKPADEKKFLDDLLKDDKVIRQGVNLLRRFTHGLQNMYAEIQTHGKFSAISTKSYTDETGKLRLGSVLPALSKRYRVTNQLAAGTFSQIFRTSDTYVNKDVCVKVVVQGFEVLGRREGAYLQFLNKKNVRGSKYFIKLLDMFYFDGHVCLTLELYKATLINFIHMPSPSIASAFSSAQGSHASHIMKPIARSIYTRYSISDMTEGKGRSGRSIEVDKMRKISLNLISALCLLRKEGIIHADIKPENIFVNWTTDSIDHITSSSSSSYSSSSSTQQYNFADLPKNFDMRIGDFGNSIQTSETADYYESFDIQTLSYRSFFTHISLFLSLFLSLLPARSSSHIHEYSLILLRLSLNHPLLELLRYSWVFPSVHR